MNSVKSAVYLHRKIIISKETGFKLDEIRLLNTTYSLNVDLSEKINFSLVNVLGATLPEKCTNFFNNPIYNNKYII